VTECEFCGETIPDDADVCPFCGNNRAKAAAEEEPTADERAIEETLAAFQDAETDDDWRPCRYERRPRRSRKGSRSHRSDRQTLQLLAGWLAALIVIAGGIFWYIWSEDEAAAQSTPLMAVITAEQR